MAQIDYNRHIWEGWTVLDFITELETDIKYVVQNKQITTKKEMQKFCKENQPYYKHHIKEVVQHFCEKYQIK